MREEEITPSGIVRMIKSHSLGSVRRSSPQLVS